VNLQSNDFELFGLTQQFAQERSALDARWKSLQAQAHPDKFAAQGGAAQRLAMQWSVRINEAYQRLKNPLQRAAYLCELHGAPIQAHSNTAMAPAFLMQQIEWREALDGARKLVDLETLAASVDSTYQDLLRQCAQVLDEQQDYAAAVPLVRSLMFIEKFRHDLDARFDALS
jgi:molecular chaperone HscB